MRVSVDKVAILVRPGFADRWPVDVWAAVAREAGLKTEVGVPVRPISQSLCGTLVLRLCIAGVWRDRCGRHFMCYPFRCPADCGV